MASAIQTGRRTIHWFWRGRQSEALGKDHAKGIRTFARRLSFPLMVALSFGAALQLSQHAVDEIIKAVNPVPGAPPVDALTAGTYGIFIAIIALFVLAMDAILIVKSVDLADLLAQESKARNDIAGHLAIVLFIAVVESVTYGMLIWRLENPHDLGSQVLVILRAIGVPVIAVLSATLQERVMTEKRMLSAIDTKLSIALSTIIDTIQTEPSLSNLPVILKMKRWVRSRQSATTTEKDDDDLLQQIRALMPDAQANEAELLRNQLANERQLLENERRIMEERMENERQLLEERMQMIEQNAKEQAAKETLTALIAVTMHGEWPEYLIEMHPQLATIPIRIGKNTSAGRRMNTSRTAIVSDDIESIYRQIFGKNPPETVKKQDGKSEKARGVWIISSDIPALVDGEMSDDEAKDIARVAGNGAKVGTALAAPLKSVLKVPRVRLHLQSVWKDWLTRSQSGTNADSATGEFPAIGGK